MSTTTPTPTYVHRGLALLALIATVLWLVLWIVNRVGVETAIFFVLVTVTIWAALDRLTP